MNMRLLAVRSEHGYTDRLDRALPEEPEAVSAEEQRQLTARAARAASDRSRSEWEARHEEIATALDGLAALPFARELQPEVRAMRAQLDRLARRVRFLL